MSYEDLTGKTFGRYKVLERLDESDSNHRPYYICECIKCGWIGKVKYPSIVKSRLNSLCHHKLDFKTFFNGKTFGKFTVLNLDHIDENAYKLNKYIYRVHCNQCGLDTLMSINSVYNAAKRKERDHKCWHLINFPEQLIGRMYGKYKIIKVVDPKNYNGEMLLKVECTKCGWKGELSLNKIKCFANLGELQNRCYHFDDINWGYSELKEKYKGMFERCYNPKCESYPNYGGRGIEVCDEWKGYQGRINFVKFALSHGFTPGLSIDRINSNGNYCPENCQFVSIQCNNTFKSETNQIHIKIPGLNDIKTAAGWSRFLGQKSTFLTKIFSKKDFKTKEERLLAIANYIIDNLPKEYNPENKIIPAIRIEFDKPQGDFNDDNTFNFSLDKLIDDDE